MSVYKNSDGRWIVDVKIKLPGQRRPTRVRRVSPVQTRRGAQRFEREVRTAILEGTLNSPEPKQADAPSLAEWAELFVREHSQARGLRPGTIREQRGAFRLYLLPILGAETRIDAIRSPHFHRLRSTLADRGLAPKTINNALGVLSRATHFYYERSGLDVPNLDVCRVKVSRNPPKFWRPEDYRALTEAAAELGPETLAAVLLMGDCGLRAGEVIALEWGHIQWEPVPQLVIQRGFHDGHFGPPKNGRPRTVPMTRRAAAAVRDLPRVRRCPWLFFMAGKGGEPTHRTHSSLAWLVCRAENRAGIRPSKRGRSHGQLHKLRHTYVTRLAASGAPARDIMELTGHAHLATVLRYMHVIPGATASAVSALESFDANQGQDGGRAGGAEMRNGQPEGSD